MVHYCRRFLFISPSVFPRLPLLGRFTILSFHCGCCLASFYLRVLMLSVDLCVSVATVFQNGISLALSGSLRCVYFSCSCMVRIVLCTDWFVGGVSCILEFALYQYVLCTRVPASCPCNTVNQAEACTSRAKENISS